MDDITLNNGLKMPLEGFGAVSYTHLDVYKRQYWGAGAAPGSI